MGVPPLGHLLQGPALLYPAHTCGLTHSLYIYGSSPHLGSELDEVYPLAGGTWGARTSWRTSQPGLQRTRKRSWEPSPEGSLES